MKTIHITALLTLTTASSAFAFTPGVSSPVTIAIVETSQVGGFSFKNDDGEIETSSEKETSKENKDGDVLWETKEEKEVLKPYKFGNKELLTQLKDEGKLDGTIKNWSIVKIQNGGAGDDPDQELFPEEVSHFYAVKKDQSPVPIDAFHIDLGVDVEAYHRIEKTVYKNDDDSTTITESGKGKAEAWLDLRGYTGKGLLSFGFKRVTGKFGKGDDAEWYELYLFNSVKLANIVGSMDDRLVEGSISIGAGKVVDLETLGF